MASYDKDLEASFGSNMIQGNTDVQVCNWHMHTFTDVWETVTKELILVTKGAPLEIVLLVFYCIYWPIYNQNTRLYL